jgi:hypothetical protein
MGSRTRGLLACGIAPQSSILKLQLISTNSNNWSQDPDGDLIPGQTGRLTVGRKITLSLAFRESLQMLGQPLWSSGQSSWLLTQRSRVRLPA